MEEKVLCRIHYDTMIENLKRAAENGTGARHRPGGGTVPLCPRSPSAQGAGKGSIIPKKGDG